MKRFKTVHYTIHSEKIKDAKGVRFAVIADYHGRELGKDNRDLLNEIDKYRPDGILIPGDMIVRNDPVTMDTAKALLKRLVPEYPVYYALGNHEYKLYRSNPKENELVWKYREYEKKLKAAGVCFLHNRSCRIEAGNSSLTVCGLEIPLIYYKKPFSPWLWEEEIRELAGDPSEDSFNILLAHSPKYGDSYFNWGADLILSGHYHGGIVRFGKHRGLLSPQLQPFPPFCCGDFHRKDQHMLVSAGAGEHTIPVRIHNPREILIVDLKPGHTTNLLEGKAQHYGNSGKTGSI